jgi:Fe-S-cluster-containing hydrogenase component 2
MLDVPVVDPDLCTSCGDCAKACVTHAIDLDDSGHVHTMAAYCVNCVACVRACPEGALSMQAQDARDLVIPDKNAEELARQKTKAKQEAQRLMEQGKKQLAKAADTLEKFDDSERK